MKARRGLKSVWACALFGALLAGLAAGGGAHAADGQTVVIGGGKVTGVYFPAAGAVCQLMNAARAADDPTCTVVPGEGSKASLEALRARLIDFAVVQSDWQFWAHRGADFFADPAPFAELNAVFALYAEPLVIAVSADSGIATLADLRDKRVGVGAPATAERGMMEALLRALGWSMSDFAEAHELALRPQTAALCDGSIDAGAYAVGSPSATLNELTAQCAVALIPIAGPAVDKLVSENSFYRAAEVPGGIYPGVEAAVPTFGVGATVVTRADVPDRAVGALIKSVFDNLDAFRALHPALGWLDADAMARAGLSAPLHPAAAQYLTARKGS